MVITKDVHSCSVEADLTAQGPLTGLPMPRGLVQEPGDCEVLTI